MGTRPARACNRTHMSLLRRRTLLRRVFAALERVASNIGLIREAGKEFRLFSHEVGPPRGLQPASG